MASTISAARANLFAALTARPFAAPTPESTPQVTFGAPAAYEEQQVIALLGVEAGSEDDEVLGGPKPREEEYTLVVGVKVYDPAAETANAVDERGWSLADEVRDEVYADRSLGGALGGAGWARVSSQTSPGALAAEGGGWVIFIEVRVLCRARVS